MPREGYRSISLTEEVFNRLEKEADATYRSVPKLVEHLLNEYEKSHKEAA